MRRWLLIGLVLGVGMAAYWAVEMRWPAPALAAPPQAAAQPKAPAAGAAGLLPALSLADLVAGKLKIVDLTWPINAKSAFWPGDNYKPFALETIATLDKDGVLSKAFSMPEHLGTHLDAPNHFAADGIAVDQIPPEKLFAPGAVIDVAPAVSTDPDYLVSVDDVRRFERIHGRIPDGAVVLAYTGWSQYWGNHDRYQGRDAMGRLHFPGFSPEAVKLLVEERDVRGVGLDTMSTDRGLSRDFAVHHVLGKAGRYGLENLARLKTLPPKGFYLVVAPIKIETGSGGPTRVFAILP
ncbi:MAG: cyclase family protein [Pirellulales bacterium]